MKKVLVTGVGGVVGQGILRNLLREDFGIGIIGTNVTAITAGNHLCDAVHMVPYAFDPDYVPAMRALVETERVDLVIPSTDYEAYHLMRAKVQIPATIAASPADVSAMCLDKYATWQSLRAKGLPFAESYLPSEYDGRFGRTVVKPREGRGSRGIHVDPADPRGFGDDHLIQEYLEGEELTTAFYVRRDGALHGAITFVRELEQGNTAKAEVVDRHDAELHPMIEALVAAFPFRGSCNLQARATKRGIIPFEINCRISGTNSVRSQFGFRDVAYTVQEYLYGQVPDAPRLSRGSAIRVIMDVIYPGIGLDQVRNRFDDHGIS
jgi:carbamoyl-phosphate synthase large subunit